jgi:ATP synthase I chain
VHDALLDRLQRTAAICCIAMAAAALVVTRDWWTAMSVIGGGLLIGISFLSIRSGVEALAAFAAGPRDELPRPNMGRVLAKLIGRYALLALLAYVMIARLRLHPLGLVAGASSVVAAAAVEAGRLFKK